jgi:hypothetical protein
MAPRRAKAVSEEPNPFAALLSPFGPLLSYWDYRPATRWFEHFITINWNSQDAGIEQHVLGEVGSYGLQLSRIIDALELLVGELELSRLPPADQQVVVRLQDLAASSRRAIGEYRGRDTTPDDTPRARALPRVADT